MSTSVSISSSDTKSSCTTRLQRPSVIWQPGRNGPPSPIPVYSSPAFVAVTYSRQSRSYSSRVRKQGIYTGIMKRVSRGRMSTDAVISWWSIYKVSLYYLLRTSQRKGSVRSVVITVASVTAIIARGRISRNSVAETPFTTLSIFFVCVRQNRDESISYLFLFLTIFFLLLLKNGQSRVRYKKCNNYLSMLGFSCSFFAYFIEWRSCHTKITKRRRRATFLESEDEMFVYV